MPIKKSRDNTVYGYPNPQATLFPDPIVLARAPVNGSDQGEIGQPWINTATNTVYFMTNNSVWTTITGGAGVFSTLTVTGLSTLGPVTQVGALSMNATGTANSTIGNATGTLTLHGPTTLTGTWTQVGTALINSTGTAATTIGNSTGALSLVGTTIGATGPTTVTGTLDATGVVTAASGVTPASAGSIIEILGGGGSAPSIVISAGVPSVTAGINKGSLAINNTATTASTRLYIFDGTAWQAFTAAG